MKKISWLLNLVLIGALIYVWKTPRKPETDSLRTVAADVETETQAAAAEAAGVAAPPVVKANPFHWNQLLQTNDYRAFVANLRLAGCPEKTVEDIVRGDVQRTFAIMRGRLQIDKTDPGPWSGQSQMNLEASLLGETPQSTEEMVAAVPDHQSRAEPTILEAFLENADLTSPDLTEEQRQQTADLRHSLLKQMNGANQASKNLDNRSFQTGIYGSQSFLAGTDGAQSSVAQIDSGTGTEIAQPFKAGNTDRPPWWHPPSKEVLMAEMEESMLGGFFGAGVAIQYEQFKAAHQSPQN